MHVLAVLIIGFIVGLIARALMRGPNPSGIILTTLLGICGAFVGQYLGVALGLYQEDQPAGFIMSVVGAIVILALLHFFIKIQYRE